MDKDHCKLASTILFLFSDKEPSDNRMEDGSSRTRLISDRQSTSCRNNPHRFLNVEIVIFLYFTGAILEIPVIHQYLYDKAKEELNVTGTGKLKDCSCYHQNSSEPK